MTPTQKGKHCAVCEKEVIDFTKATDEQLYKTATNGGNLCGRFTKNQLDRPIQLQRKQGRSLASYAASLLIPATMLATQEIKAQNTAPATEQTNGNYTSLGISSLSRKQNKSEKTVQQKTRIIEGTISGSDGPIPFASVHLKGTRKNVQTDIDGNYTFEVTTGDMLIFDALGYENTEIKITEQQTLNVVLKDVLIIMMGKLRLEKSSNTPH
jgi:hypothetical protein